MARCESPRRENTGDTAMLTPHRLVALAIVLMCVAYARIIPAPFVYEDAMSVKAVDRLTWQTPSGWLTTGRALTRLSLDANYLYGGMNPMGYHAVNVGLHGLNGALVYALGTAIMPTAAAAVAASVFLLHPIQREAVSYVSGRSELLSTLFVLLALWCVTGPLTKRRGVGFLLCAAAAMASKETGAVVVLLAPLLAWVVKSDREWYALIALIPGVAMLHAVAALHSNYYAFASPRQWLGFPALQSVALWSHLWHVVTLQGFSIDHDIEVIAPALALCALIAVLAWCVVSGLLLRRSAVIGFALAWPLLALAPRFVIRIPEYLNEHQLYLPLIGVWWLAGMACVRVMAFDLRMETHRWHAS